MKKIEHIVDLIHAQHFKERSVFVGAYIACLSEETSCDFLMSCIKSNRDKGRNAVLRKVYQDIKSAFLPCHEVLLVFLRETTSDSDTDFRIRRSAAYCLSELSGVVPAKKRRDIEVTFLSSEYRGFRKRAYKTISDSGNVPEHLLQKAWENYRDWECGWLIINNASADYLIKHRKELLELGLEGWYLSKLYIRIGEVAPKYLRELKDIDLISYCYVLANVGWKLQPKEALKIVESSLDDERFGILIWSFGQLKLWSVLIKIEKLLMDRRNAQKP